MTRRGRFTVSRDFLEASGRDLARVLFAHVVVTRVEYDLGRDLIEYTGCSELFEPIPDGALAPEYTITFKRVGAAVLLHEIN